MKINVNYAYLLLCASILNSSPTLMCMAKTQAKTSWYLQGSKKILTEKTYSLANSRVQSPTPLKPKRLKPLEINPSTLSKPLISASAAKKLSIKKPTLPRLDLTQLQTAELMSEKSTLAKHSNQTDLNPRIPLIARALLREETTDNFSEMANLKPTVSELEEATNLLRQNLLQAKKTNSLFTYLYEDTDCESDNEDTILFINDGKKRLPLESSHSEEESAQLQQAYSRLERESAHLQQAHLQAPVSTNSSLFFLGDLDNDYYSPREDSLRSSNGIISQ